MASSYCHCQDVLLSLASMWMFIVPMTFSYTASMSPGSMCNQFENWPHPSACPQPASSNALRSDLLFTWPELLYAHLRADCGAVGRRRATDCEFMMSVYATMTCGARYDVDHFAETVRSQVLLLMWLCARACRNCSNSTSSIFMLSVLSIWNIAIVTQ